MPTMVNDIKLTDRDFRKLRSFIDECNWRIKSNTSNFALTEWVKTNCLWGYYRNSIRLLNGKQVYSLDVAMLEITDDRFRGRGVFKQVLNEIETRAHHDIVYVENVINEHLYDFLKNRGYEDHGQALNSLDGCTLNVFKTLRK